MGYEYSYDWVLILLNVQVSSQKRYCTSRYIGIDRGLYVYMYIYIWALETRD